MRTVQRLVDGEWKPISFYQLQCGDYFRLFDNITPVGDYGKYIFHATSDPYSDGQGEQRIDYDFN